MATMGTDLLEVNSKINDVLERCEAEEDRIDADTAKASNDAFEPRTKYLAEKGLTASFWQNIVRKHPDLAKELFGSYDDEILSSLSKIHGAFGCAGPIITASAKKIDEEKDEAKAKEMTSQGPPVEAFDRRIELHFNQNPFFTDSVLWMQMIDSNIVGESYKLRCSGIKWKEGKGPDDAADGGSSKRSSKRGKGGDVEGKKKREREDKGPTFFEIFHPLPPEPLGEEAEEDEDDEEMEELQEEWASLLDERCEVFGALFDEIWCDPLGVHDGKMRPQGIDIEGEEEEEEDDEEDDYDEE